MQAVVHAHILMGHVTTKSLLIAMKKKRLKSKTKIELLYFRQNTKWYFFLLQFHELFQQLCGGYSGRALGFSSKKVDKKVVEKNVEIRASAKRDDETIKNGVFFDKIT